MTDIASSPGHAKQQTSLPNKDGSFESGIQEAAGRAENEHEQTQGPGAREGVMAKMDEQGRAASVSLTVPKPHGHGAKVVSNGVGPHVNPVFRQAIEEVSNVQQRRLLATDGEDPRASTAHLEVTPAASEGGGITSAKRSLLETLSQDGGMCKKSKRVDNEGEIFEHGATRPAGEQDEEIFEQGGTAGVEEEQTSAGNNALSGLSEAVGDAGANRSGMSSPRGSVMSCLSEGSASFQGQEHAGDGRDGQGVAIKLFLQDKIFRFRASSLHQIEQHVDQKLKERFGGGKPPAFELTYLDSDDDEITLTDESDFQEAVVLMCSCADRGPVGAHVEQDERRQEGRGERRSGRPLKLEVKTKT